MSFVLIDIGEVKRKPSHWVFRAPRFARSLAGAETLDSQSSTLASPWQGAYGFKEPPGSLRNLLITDSIDSYRLNLNNRHSKPFSPVTPAQPPSRPGRSASAAEAATRQPNGGARVAYYSRKMVGAHAVAHHLPRPRRSDQDERLRPHESTRQTQY